MLKTIITPAIPTILNPDILPITRNSDSDSSKLSGGYIALIVISILMVIGTIIYVKRNYTFFRTKTINVKRSFQATV